MVLAQSSAAAAHVVLSLASSNETCAVPWSHVGEEGSAPGVVAPKIHGGVPEDIRLVAAGGFELADATPAAVLETEDPVLTVWTQKGFELWPLPRGELLSAWSTSDGLHLVLADSTGAALLLDLPADLSQAVPSCALPGAGACATARHLRSFVVSPRRDFFALADMDQHGVSIYRAPCGALASPMATIPSGDGGSTVHALVATADGSVVLRNRSSARGMKPRMAADPESMVK
eukprot:Skav228612  [mRNA]  locus=scaffold2037:25773:32087:+ [translate_table: standard]